jgi:drug/metabolite transporter (DMT)-like permease
VLSGFGLGLPSFNLFVGGSQGLFGAVVLLFSFPAGIDFEVAAKAWSIGVLQAFTLIFMFWMLKREDPSRVIPAMQTSPIYVALLAWMIFGESLSALQWTHRITQSERQGRIPTNIPTSRGRSVVDGKLTTDHEIHR